MKQVTSHLLYYCLLSIIVLLFDRITKYYALRVYVEEYVLNKFISFELLFNRGVSWGLFHSNNTNAFLIVTTTVIMISIIFTVYAYKRLRSGFSIIGEVLVLTGSLSNCIDRIMYHGVIDFIVLSYNNWSWPVFNGADIVIVCGIIIMILQGYTEK